MTTQPPNTTALATGNLFSNISGSDGDAEQFIPLMRDSNVQIEKIVSHGGETQWFDQDTVEFVVLLQGSATMQFEGEKLQRELTPGDYYVIPKHKRHRVTSTARGKPTVWLAFHWK